MTSRYWQHAALAGASFWITSTASFATPQVVGDEACARYEVDMASFASCADGKVVQPAIDAQDLPLVVLRDGPRYASYFAPEARHRATLLLAAIALDFDAASGTSQRVERSSGCDLAPQGVPIATAQLR